MTATINTKDYWPLFKHNGVIRYDYTGAKPDTAPLAAEIFYDAQRDSMVFKEFNVTADGKDEWRDTWYYRYVEGFGISEFRDDYPSPGSWWGDVKIVSLNPAIGWGDTVKIGDTYSNEPAFEPEECVPPQIAYGNQVVKFERKYDEYQNAHGFWIDVVRFRYYQWWNGGQKGGAIYHFAPARGPVTQQFLAVLQDGTEVYSDIYSATVKLIDWPKGEGEV